MTARAKATRAEQPAKPIEPVSFLDVMTSPALMGRWFNAPTWSRWLTFAKSFFAEPLNPEEMADFRRLTERDAPQTEPAREGYLIVGRRGGKSRFAAALAVYAACFRDYSALLAPGERAWVMVFASDKSQAGSIFGFIRGFFEEIPALAGLLKKPLAEQAESIHLSNRVSIVIQVASFRRLRGKTVVAAICDEIAFWYNDEESRNPDSEVIRALKPAMLNVPGSFLVAISSPYARRGVLWDAYKAHWGRAGDRVLVVKADTLSMNPGADRAEIDAAYLADPESARAEYGGEFRVDLESYVSPEAVERVVVKGRFSLPFVPGSRFYGFFDAAGGSGQDSQTLAIVRRTGDRTVVCAIREWRPPFSPEDAIADASLMLKEFSIDHVTGDHYGGDWPAARFKANRIAYVVADQTKSDLYQSFLPLVNEQRVELLDHPRTNGQLLALEKMTGRSGKDSISHPPNGHDDLINAVAGACVLAQRRKLLEGHQETKVTPRAEQPRPGVTVNGGVTTIEGVRYYGDCKACGQQHIVSKAGDDATPSCPQGGWGWSAGYGPGYGFRGGDDKKRQLDLETRR